MPSLSPRPHGCTEEAWQVLDRQEQSRREGHKEILSDISDVRGNIREVWQRLGGSIGTLCHSTIASLKFLLDCADPQKVHT